MAQLLLFMNQIRYRITKVVCRLISKCTSQTGLLDDICISKERAQSCFTLAVIPIIGDRYLCFKSSMIYPKMR